MVVKWSEVKGGNRGVLLRLYMCSEDKVSEGHFTIGVQYLWKNNFINYAL